MFILQAFHQPKEYNGIITEDMECLFLKFQKLRGNSQMK